MWTATGPDPASCGTETVAGLDGTPGIYLEPLPDGSHDGWYDVGPVTASPPAAFPERA